MTTDHYDALIYIMVVVSAADTHMTDTELRIIGDVVNHLPVFADYDHKRLKPALDECVKLMSQENGLQKVLRTVKAALPERLRETGYLLACDVAAADGEASQEELRLLELLRDSFEIDPLVAAALERGARVRFRKL